MASRLRAGRFEIRAWRVLILLVLFLVALDLSNLFLLSRSNETLARAEHAHATSRIRELTDEVGTATLVAAIGPGDDSGPLSAWALRRLAMAFGYDRVVLLDPSGREVLASGRELLSPGAAYEELSDSVRETLHAGRPVTGPMTPSGGGSEARLTTFMPFFDDSGRLSGFVRAVHRVPDLGAARQRYRLVLVVQIVGVIVIAGLVMLFARWVSGPYRRLVEAAGEAGLPEGRGDGAADPEHLAAAFRAVVAKLREQDDAMGSVERRGGLSDLVRFASRGAREMSSGVLVVDRRARVASMNPAAAALLGHDRVGSRGRPIAGVGDRVSGLASRVHTCLRSGVATSREVLPVEEGAGRVGHLGVSISPAIGRNDEIAGALVLMTDLTEIRQLQEQARLRENMASAGRLSAGIAHEFRNALGTILGYAKMLSKRDDPEVRGPAERIVREVDSVRATVDEFLLFARPPQPESEPVAVREILEDCVASTGTAVKIEITGEFGEVLGNETLLQRAFANLIRNAADTAEEEGRTLHVRISGRVVAGGRALRIDIEDDGPGIPPEAREQIFDPFFTTRSRGTGLGLALVQRTLVDLGGSIEAGQSKLGGAIFRIRVPRVVRDAGRRQA